MRTLTRVTVAMLAVLCMGTAVQAQNSDAIIPDVVYGHHDGMALTFDVFSPAGESNGVGILNMVSGGWVSRWRPPQQARAQYAALLDEGFTVFSIRHGSSPRFNVLEAYADVTLAVRFVRLNARDLGIDPERLGVYGGSAGGHLSLMQGTAGSQGDAAATDPVDRQSSRVQAVVAYFPPTDFLNYGVDDGHFDKHVRELLGGRNPFLAAVDFYEFDQEKLLWEGVCKSVRRARAGREVRSGKQH